MTKTAKLSQAAATLLRTQADRLGRLRATVGLDGFVDAIIAVVAKRESAEKFSRVATIAEFGQRIIAAAGRSANIELVVERTKLGGNGAIMAHALALLGVQVTYVGNAGYPAIHPVFADLARRATVRSMAEPGYTDALEFDDGKLMFGKHAALHEVTWANLLARVGRDQLLADFTQADLVGLQNWTMLPYMSDIWEHVLTELCPALPAAPRRQFFFDLADPAKRDREDLRRAVATIGRFQQYFDTHLGLNESEGRQVAAVLGYRGSDDVLALARYIREQLPISTVVVHPRAFAVAASASGVVKVDGPTVPRPVLSTGGGDHFNAGFCLGKLLAATDEVALQLGVAVSGYYVSRGQTPTTADLIEFLESL